jgi:hypothetical protein
MNTDRIDGRMHAVVREGDSAHDRKWSAWLLLAGVICGAVLTFQLLPWGA